MDAVNKCKEDGEIFREAPMAVIHVGCEKDILIGFRTTQVPLT